MPMGCDDLSASKSTPNLGSTCTQVLTLSIKNLSVKDDEATGFQWNALTQHRYVKRRNFITWDCGIAVNGVIFLELRVHLNSDVTLCRTFNSFHVN